MSENYLESTTQFIVGAHLKDEPMPTKEELLSRNSFGGPSNNKYLDKMFGVKGVQRKVIKLK